MNVAEVMPGRRFFPSKNFLRMGSTIWNGGLHQALTPPHSCLVQSSTLDQKVELKALLPATSAQASRWYGPYLALMRAKWAGSNCQSA